MPRDFSREYWKPKAEGMIDEEHGSWELLYGVDSRDVLDLGEEFGYDRLTRNLRIKEAAQAAYWEGDYELAHEIWEDRDEDFPDWFWGYHGVNA
jgi:hypothetical protein